MAMRVTMVVATTRRRHFGPQEDAATGAIPLPQGELVCKQVHERAGGGGLEFTGHAVRQPVGVRCAEPVAAAGAAQPT